MDFKDKFFNACYLGDLEGVKNVLSQGYSETIDFGMRLAYQNSRINIIDYLCNSPDLPQYGHKNYDIHHDNDEILLTSIMYDNMPVVRCVFEHMEKYHYPKYDWVIGQFFTIAPKYPHLLEFMIIEKNFNKDILMTFIHEDNLESMNNLYDKCILYKELQSMSEGATTKKEKL